MLFPEGENDGAGTVTFSAAWAVEQYRRIADLAGEAVSCCYATGVAVTVLPGQVGRWQAACHAGRPPRPAADPQAGPTGQLPVRHAGRPGGQPGDLSRIERYRR